MALSYMYFRTIFVKKNNSHFFQTAFYRQRLFQSCSAIIKGEIATIEKTMKSSMLTYVRGKLETIAPDCLL
jgi:hypothetical protein